MKRNKIALLIVALFCVVSFISCDRYPVEAIVGIPGRIDSWPNPWFVYDDQINTRGNMEPFRWVDDPYCASWLYASVDFSHTGGVKRGNRCMKFTWVGDQTDTSGATYFGFGLMAREVLGEKMALGKAGYINMKFWIRGSLTENCSFRIEIPGTMSDNSATLNSSQVTSEWTEVTVPLDIYPTEEVEYVIAFALKPTDASLKTNGGTVYLDDIRFVK